MVLADIQVSYETALSQGAAVKALSRMWKANAPLGCLANHHFVHAVAGFVALLYDHILTRSNFGAQLDLEVDLIWRARPGFVSVVFLLNRYIVPLVLIVDTYGEFLFIERARSQSHFWVVELSGVAPNSVMFCKVWTVVQSYLTIASFMSIHAVMAIRVYALHSGRRCMRWFLWISDPYHRHVFIIDAKRIILKRDSSETLQPLDHQCVGTVPSYLWLAWLPTVVFESLLFAVTLIALIEQDDCRSLSRLTLILYRDGMLYFVAVTFCSTFCLLVWALAPPTLNGLARYFALAIVNITASRMVLNLKSYSASRRRPAVFTDSGFFDQQPSFAFIPRSLPPSPQLSQHHAGSSSPMSSFDLEMYAIEREYQQLGTKLR
ncbi:hypothetical protein NM688_g6152 [Phlebia brevispora]|uniref:Uncharacterized protein n=1 Tax=Phlebia brevispora TaxID=194682 RepID=A0ACC1SJF8_9APHY|nr:hypothetical protein NM688_g6152 [Phlebia brevispora]